MPSKQSFSISKVTSYEEGFSPQNLEQHSPYNSGWCSGRYCNYPQQMIIKFEDRLRLRKIQILSHDYMISQRIDIYCSCEELMVENSFTRLGYITLSDNQHTGFQAREMKSINLDITCYSLKFILQKNHINKLNLFNQVSISAINIIGDQSNTNDTTNSILESPNNSINNSNNNNNNNIMIDQIIKGHLTRPHVSYMDDLLFAVYTDPEIVYFIQLLEDRKLLAVANEEFDVAGLLKQAVADLREAGRKLAKIEVEKKDAVEKEDYSRAKVKKQQSDEFRMNTYTNLNLTKLLMLSDAEFTELRSTIVSNARTETSTSQQKILQTKLAKTTSPIHNDVLQPNSLGKSVHGTNLLPYSSVHNPQFSNIISSYSQNNSLQQTHGPTASDEIISLAVPETSNPVTNSIESSIPITPKIAISNTSIHKEHTYKPEHTSLPIITSTSPQLTAKFSEITKTTESNTFRPLTPDYSTLDYDNIVLPTLRQSGQMSITEIDSNNSININQGSLKHDPDKPEQLSEKNAKLFTSALDLFGYTTVSQLLSKHFKQRENGLHSVIDYFKSYNIEESSHSPSSVLYAIIELLRRLLSDKIFPVFQLAVTLLTYLLNDYVTNQHVETGCVTSLVDKCYRELITRIGDSTSHRVRIKAMEISLEIVTYSSIKKSYDILRSVLLSPLKPSAPPKLASSRLDLVKAVIELKKPLSSLGLSPSHVATFGMKLLEHHHSSVRDSAISMLTVLHGLHSNAVRSLLPQNNTLEAKNPTYKTLIDALYKSTDVTENNVSSSVQLSPSRDIVTPTLSKPLRPKSTNLGVTPKKTTTTTPNKKQITSINNTTHDLDTSRAVSPIVPIARYMSILDISECPLCGFTQPDITSDILENHYKVQCCMLTVCSHCKQLVEISSLNAHYIIECSAAETLKQCEKCQVVLPEKLYSKHTATKNCLSIPQGSQRCPLCSLSVKNFDDNWKEHLMAEKGCTNNPRRRKNNKRSTVTSQVTPSKSTTLTHNSNSVPRPKSGAFSSIPTSIVKKTKFSYTPQKK